MERRGKGGREEREEKGKEGGKGPSPPRKKILAPPLYIYILGSCIFATNIIKVTTNTAKVRLT